MDDESSDAGFLAETEASEKVAFAGFQGHRVLKGDTFYRDSQ